MSRREDAYDAGYDPAPQEQAEDARHEPGRSFRAPRQPIRVLDDEGRDEEGYQWR